MSRQAKSHGHSESDWDDQDLLTIDLATQRLDDEIVALQQLLATRAEADDDVDLSDTKARLESLLAARERLGRPKRTG